MILSFLRPRFAAGLLALTLLGGTVSSRADTEASSGTLTFNHALDGSSIVNNGNYVVLTKTPEGTVIAVFGANGVPVTGGTITPGLFGSVNDLNFKTTKDGATRAKATVDLVNTSGTSLRNITATVYLSADDTLSANDLQIAKLDLSDYVAKGKIAKYDTDHLPFDYKLSSAEKSYLNGKYLIIVLSADNLGTLETAPIVVGPISIP